MLKNILVEMEFSPEKIVKNMIRIQHSYLKLFTALFLKL